jgi:hypothetical protein
MPKDDARLLADRLDDLHAALRGGKLHDLTALAQAITEQATALHAADPACLPLLQRKAARNAACLQAAANGIRAARRRLKEIRAMASGGATYDRDGRREGSAVPAQHLVQRF